MDFERMMKDIMWKTGPPPEIQKEINKTWEVPDNLMSALEALIEKVKEIPKSETFKIGDMITPTKNATVNGRGNPHIVLTQHPILWDTRKSGYPAEPTVGAIGTIHDNDFKIYQMDDRNYELFDVHNKYGDAIKLIVSRVQWPLPRNSARAVQDLKKAAASILFPKQCPFKIGDIITPKRDSGKLGRGAPHYVTTIHTSKPVITFYDNGQPGDATDMVVSLIGADMLLSFMNKSEDYELFDVNANY